MCVHFFIGENMEDIVNILIKEAKKSLKTNDVPVSAVIVDNGKIIAKAHNSREKYHDVTSHAEILALQKACKKNKTWHLDECEIYVTMEPCLMCMNAISQSRIKKIYYVLDNDKFKEIQNTMNDKIIKTKILDPNNELNNLIKNFFIEKRK